jgi:aspartyl aminopeptidase
MHSCYETAGVQDSLYLEDAMAAYYSSDLQLKDGNFQIK